MDLVRRLAAVAIGVIAASGCTDLSSLSLTADAGSGRSDDLAGLTVNAALGLDLVDARLLGEGALVGTVTVLLDGEEPPAGTTVSLNGTALAPRQSSSSVFEFDPAMTVALAAGGTARLEAHSGVRATVLEMPCPAEPQMSTAPAAGTALSEGRELMVSWTGDIYLDGAAAAGAAPYVAILPYDGEANIVTGPAEGPQRAVPMAPQQTVSVTVPAPGPTGYLVELGVPGAQVEARNAEHGKSVGACGLRRRAKFGSVGSQ